MSLSTPAAAESKRPKAFRSPTSVTELTEDGQLRLSDEALEYIDTSFSSEEDPYVLIHWVDDGVADALDAIHGNIIQALPAPPVFLDTTTAE